MALGTYIYGFSGGIEHRIWERDNHRRLEQKNTIHGLIGKEIQIPFFNNHFAIIAKVEEAGRKHGFEYVKLSTIKFATFFNGHAYYFKTQSISGDSICLQIL